MSREFEDESSKTEDLNYFNKLLKETKNRSHTPYMIPHLSRNKSEYDCLNV